MRPHFPVTMESATIFSFARSPESRPFGDITWYPDDPDHPSHEVIPILGLVICRWDGSDEIRVQEYDAAWERQVMGPEPVGPDFSSVEEAKAWAESVYDGPIEWHDVSEESSLG